MLYKTFTIPLYDNDDEIESLNRFISGHKIINIEKNLIQSENKYYWNFLIEYVKTTTKFKSNISRSKVDYKELLSPEDFSIFVKLREIRKKIAEEQGLPLYAVFTNEQLSKIVTEKISTKSKLSEIQGVGNQKVNFASPILDYMKGLINKDEKSGKSL